VLDGEVATDFPDIWSKTIVFHPQKGSVLIIPRERAMTRLYIELKADTTAGAPLPPVDQESVMERARQICAPYKLEWKTVEWFGRYQIGQRVANKFMDENRKVFIAGDASHTHSPKAAQGMNTSVHDSWNLGWKLNLEVRGLAKPILLQSYEDERRKIAQDLINFDFEHANSIAAGDSSALAENFRINTRFISGVGVEYSNNVLNHAYNDVLGGGLKPGSILPPSKAIRYIDHNPVDVQLDIPILGQFRIYVLVHDVVGSAERLFLEDLSRCITAPSSLMSRTSAAAQQSYAQKPRLQGKEDVYFRHDRYTPISDMFTFALISKFPTPLATHLRAW
jgi:phenol 2-monooxygenase